MKVAVVVATVVAAVAGALCPPGNVAASIGLTGAVWTAAGGAVFVAAAAGAALAAVAIGGSIAASIQEGLFAGERALNAYSINGRKTQIPHGYKRVEQKSSRIIGGSFKDRMIIKDYTQNEIEAILCPDYTVNQPLYNQIFTGGEFTLRHSQSQSPNYLHYIPKYPNQKNLGFTPSTQEYYFFSNEGRHFYMPSQYQESAKQTKYIVNLQGVGDNIAALGIKINYTEVRQEVQKKLGDMNVLEITIKKILNLQKQTMIVSMKQKKKKE